MADGGNLSIDALQLQISANATSATQSLDSLITALGNLKRSLGDLSGGARNITKMADAFQKMNSFKDLDLSRLTTQLERISKVDLKPTGIAAFANSMKRFGDVSKNLDFSALTQLHTQLSQLKDVSSNTTELLKAVSSFARASDKMGEAANKFPTLAMEIKEFFDEMSNVTISDNVATMASALADISRHGKSTSTAMQAIRTSTDGANTAISRGGTVMKMLGSTAKDTASILKGMASTLFEISASIGSGILNGVKSLVTQFKQLTSASSGLKTLAQNLRTMLGVFVGFYGIRSVFGWVKDAVKSGADVAEVNHIVEATFGDLSDGVKEWATTTMDNYGIAENAAKRYAGTLGAVFQSSGVGLTESAEMSQRLVEIAGDLSSFYNIDTETVYTKLKSGMAGMVRPLRDVGIDLSVASLSAFALEQGITKSWQSMSQAEKISLRYQYILQATSNVQGDFSRTSGSMANQLRTLRAYAASITQTIGDGLASALRHVIRYLNIAAKYVLKLASAFAGFMKTLFGANISGGGAGLIDTESFDDVADDLSDASDSAVGTSDGLGDAAENAQKLEKALSVLPFDELNQLNKDTQTAGSSGGTGGSPGGGVGGLGDLGDLGLLDQMQDAFDASKLPDAINRWAERIKEAFKAHDWIGLGRELAWGINKGLQWLYDLLDPKNIEEKVLPYVSNFATVMNSLVDNINWDLLGRTFGRGLNTLLMIANTWLTSFSWSLLGKKLAEGANGLVDEIRWDYLGQFFANKLNMIWQTAYNFVSNFDWKLLGESLAVAFDNFVATVDFDAIGGTISEGLNGITEAVNTFLNKFDAEGFGTKLGNAFKHMVSNVKAEQIGLALSGVWNKAWVILKNFVTQLGNNELGSGTGIGAKIHKVIETAITNLRVDDMVVAIKTFVRKVTEDIALIFGDIKMWHDLGEKIGGAVGDILSDGQTWVAIANAINAVTGALLSLLKGAIKGLWSHKEEIGGGIRRFLVTLDWGNIAKVVGAAALAAFVKAVPMLVGWAALKKALIPQIKAVFSQVATADEVVKSGASIFDGIRTALEGAGLGAGAAEGGLIGLLIMATAEVAKFQDALKGGNGFFTEGGAAIQEYINQMQKANTISDETAGKLFKLKEAWESGEIDDNAFFSQFGKILEEGGTSAETAQNALGNLEAQLHLTDEQIGTVKDSISGMSEATTTTEEKFASLGLNSKEAVDGIRDAIWNLDETTGNAVSNGQADELFKTFNNGGSDAVTALQAVMNEMTNLGLDTDLLRQAIDAKLGDGAFDALVGSAGDAKTSVNDLKTDVENTNTSVNNLETSSQQVPTKIQNGIDLGKKVLLGALAILSTNMASALLGDDKDKDKFKDVGENIPPAVKQGIENVAQDATDAVATLGTDLIDKFKEVLDSHSPSREFESMGETAPEGVAQGIENTSDEAISAIETLGDSMTDTFNSIIDNLRSELQSGGADMIESGLIDGVTSALGSFDPAGEIDNTFSGVWDTLNSISSEMYNAGQTISQSLSDGIQSVHITLPHISTSWDTITYGDGSWVQIPNFSVDWYARGGLFTNPTIAGFGEAGDEAALPLENRRAMSRIANAIIDSADGGLGMNEDKMASAVARGYVQAMMMNQGNVQPPIFHIEVKTEDNEVLARAVQRGYQSMDYRQNATPSFGF